MFTRNQVRAQYAVVNSTIIGNDEFRGEPVYAPHFFFRACESDWNASDTGVEIFSRMNEEQTTQFIALVRIKSEERSEFPELGVASHVLVTQDPDIEQVITRQVFVDEVEEIRRGRLFS